MVRVLVGRHDVLTPEEERKLEHPICENAEYQKVLGSLGRYMNAAHGAAQERMRKAEETKPQPR